MKLPGDGRRRVTIEAVSPQVDGGRFPAKRTVGDVVVVEADLLVDGHDQIGATLRHRHERQEGWEESEMRSIGNDRWRATFPVSDLGSYLFTILAWVDAFSSWRFGFERKLEAGQDVGLELKVGARLVARTAKRAGRDAERLASLAATMRGRAFPEAIVAATDPALSRLMAAHPDRRHAAELSAPARVLVERELACCGAWYEMFPRSASARPGRHGTFDDVIALLPELESLGFDVLYLPPIHPIGRTNRKGRNNTQLAKPGDVGSPWAIGAVEGGHTAVHPDLGTLDDFGRLVEAAADHGIEVALDLTFQCSPDHPWVREHPEWFTRLPDGSIRPAENPPKRYEDIYPLNFETPAWKALWAELLEVVRFWTAHGVKVFRVDNPHTKPFAMWEWLLAEVREREPEVVFLSEAFTRPKVMYRLAKLGFSQSYTYFTWRHTKDEIEAYAAELTTPPVSNFFRPNLWPSTPDILTAELQSGDRGVFAVRFLLAATLAASYGIYGPAFELGEHIPKEPGSEEYRNSEKYEIRRWDVSGGEPLRDLVARVNRIRHEHEALRRNETLRFHRIDNPMLLSYSKRSADGSDVVLVVVNLDPVWPQSGWTNLDLDALGLTAGAPFTARDLLTGEAHGWRGSTNYVELRPGLRPAHVFSIDPQPIAAQTTRPGAGP